ncbi:hypothetical protein KY495_10755 [Massilia sp. PAMC28688]|uniref:S41 family peptidase n=1 Tax=Massilia sp. PAMC28688 TaxID=2861283 RepID=UPI001C627E95|nr:S41 family peptidase [Massilia sp. PAMC28688]QYF95580.1 hypothetical protein KY495_10755 [Massilia sp. PAMC28688]
MRLTVFLLLSLLSLPAPPAVGQTPLLSAAQLGEDLAEIQSHMALIHPDPGFAGQGGDIAQAMARVGEQLTVPLSREQAWAAFATLNPAFADAHMQVTVPDVMGQTRAHLDAGGKLFPFEVVVEPDATLRIRSALGGGSTAYAGAAITRINGQPAQQVVRTLLARAAGDSEGFRANHLSWRMWLPYWKMFGAPPSFQIEIAGKGLVQVAASGALPEALKEDFEHLFRFDILPGGAALLTVSAFMAEDPRRFLAFTRAAFARMQASGATVLIIDVRQNGGGDDALWKEGILPYLASKPYRHTSSYIKKVIAGRDSAAEALGSVVRADHHKWHPPELANPLRFTGQTYVLVGRMTYSSAVLFANVMQDFGFGKLVGERGYARTRQSGGTQVRTLPHSGLTLVVPRMVLERPAGPQAQPLLAPDIVLPDDPVNRRGLIDALLAWHHRQAAQ